MLRTSLIVLGVVLASSGLAVAQQSGSDSSPSHPPPGMKKHHHRMPPPPPAGLQGKGFDLQLGHGKSLRVQCGDEQLKSCIQSAQPLLQRLRGAQQQGGMPQSHGEQSMGHMGQGSSSGHDNDSMHQGQQGTPDPTQKPKTKGDQT